MHNETLKKLKTVLDGLVNEKNNLREDEKAENETARLALIIAGLDDIARSIQTAQIGKDEMLSAMSQITVTLPSVVVPAIKIPEIKIPEIKFPTPQVTVHIPKIELPTINVPEPRVTVHVAKQDPPIIPPFPQIVMPDVMNTKGWLGLMGYSQDFLKNPLPVQLRDSSGNPVKLFENLTTLMSQGGGGGKHDYFTIKGFSQSAYSELTNADGRLKVSMESGEGSLTNTELRAASVQVEQVSGSIWSTNVIGTVPVSVGATLDVQQVSGANWSIAVLSIAAGTNNIGDVDVLTLPALVAGTANIGDVDILTIAAGDNNIGNVDIVTMPAVVVTSITNSTAASVVDSGGIQYSGSNPLPTYLVLGSGNSTISVGPVLHGAIDDGAAPQKVGGVAVQANPTAVAGGDMVRFVADDIGRQVMTIHQVRDLIVTARAAPTTVAPTTLLAGGGAGVFHDLISITASNASTAANTAAKSWITFDVLDSVAGGPVLTFTVENGNTLLYTPPVPIKQSEGGNAWQIDITSDESTLAAAPLVVTALFAKNV